jgi:hypothetical protein
MAIPPNYDSFDKTCVCVGIDAEHALDPGVLDSSAPDVGTRAAAGVAESFEQAVLHLEERVDGDHNVDRVPGSHPTCVELLHDRLRFWRAGEGWAAVISFAARRVVNAPDFSPPLLCRKRLGLSS